MKIRIDCGRVIAVVVMVLCSQASALLLAQNSNQTPASAEAVAPVTASDTSPSPIKLSFGVPEILKLGRAHVGDEVIIAFISSSSRVYSLSVSEILYLREQGMSDQVVAAMLNTRQNATATAAQVAPQPAPIGPTSVWANTSPQPRAAPAYVPAAPLYTQPSPVYVYPAPSYGYYDSWPYHWGYPGLLFSFGFGGGHYGGYRGGGYHGGGGGHQ